MVSSGIYKRISFAITVFLVVTSQSTNAFCQDVDMLSLAHIDRTDGYCGLKFKYESRRVVGTVVESLENELTFQAPLGSTSTVLRRLWVTFRAGVSDPLEKDTTLLNSFCGFDGKEGRLFTRQYTDETKIEVGFVPRHQGGVSAFDPGAYQNNRFEEFLTGGPHLIPQYSDRDGSGIRRFPIQFSFVDELIYLGEPCVRMAWSGDGAQKSEAIVSKLPGNLTLHVEISGPTGILVESSVSAIGEFENVRYPQSGEYIAAPVGELSGERYEFSVTGVERAPLEKVFFPDWPIGSVATGPAGELIVNLPYPPDKVLSLMTDKPHGNSSRLAINLLLAAIAVSVATYYIARISRKK